MSALRDWIIKELKKDFPSAPTVYLSDAQPKFNKFAELTGVTHDFLLETWFGPKDKETKLRKPVPGVTDPNFTTCTGFIAVFSNRIRSAGGLATEYVNFQTGKTQKITTRAFEQEKEIGWVANAGGKKAQPGDFFLIGHEISPGQNFHEHAGIILEISDGYWSKVAGGAGSQGSTERRDSCKRTVLEAPGGVLGWINVDKHFQGWAGPGAEDAIYDEPAQEDIYDE